MRILRTIPAITVATFLGFSASARQPQTEPQTNSPGQHDRTDRNGRGTWRSQDVASYRFHSAQAFKGTNVLGSNGEKIGDVEDAIFDRFTGRLQAVIVKPGMLSNKVAIPMQGLTWRTENEQPVLAVGMTEAELKSLPAFGDLATWRGLNDAAQIDPTTTTLRDPFETGARSDLSSVKGTIERVDTLSMTDGQDYMIVVVTEDGRAPRRVALGPSWYTRSTGTMPFRGAVITVKGYNSETDGEPLLVATEMEDSRGKSARYRDGENRPTWFTTDESSDRTSGSRYLMLSNLKGRDVQAQDESCGEVYDVLFERNSGEVAFISIDPNETFLGIGDTKRLVPFSLAFIPDEGAVQIDATKAMILASMEQPTSPDTLSTESGFGGIYKPYGVEPRRFWGPSAKMPMDDTTSAAWDRAGARVKAAGAADRVTINGTVASSESTTLGDGLGEANVVRVTADSRTYDVVLGPAMMTQNHRAAIQTGETLKLTLVRMPVGGREYWLATNYTGSSKNVVLWDDQARPAWRTAR